MFYYEWVQPPGSDRFTGQQLLPEGNGVMVSGGQIRGDSIQWEAESVISTARIADNGLRIVDGSYRKMGAAEKSGLHSEEPTEKEIGQFTGVQMRLSDLKPLRPKYAPEMSTWFTVGLKGLARATGKLYYEVKLGMDLRYPQLGWLTEEFEEKDNDSNGVGDDSHGWATDGVRHKFWHEKPVDSSW